MIIIILLACVVGALALYFGIIRPFLIPLTWRIPTAACYRPTLGVRR